MQAHGDCDPVVPYRWGQLTSTNVKLFVKNHEFKTYKGLSHSSSPVEMMDIKHFMQRLLPAEKWATTPCLQSVTWNFSRMIFFWGGAAGRGGAGGRIHTWVIDSYRMLGIQFRTIFKDNELKWIFIIFLVSGEVVSIDLILTFFIPF